MTSSNISCIISKQTKDAAVVELADTRDLKSLAPKRTGSTPVSGTKERRHPSGCRLSFSRSYGSFSSQILYKVCRFLYNFIDKMGIHSLLSLRNQRENPNKKEKKVL